MRIKSLAFVLLCLANLQMSGPAQSSELGMMDAPTGGSGGADVAGAIGGVIGGSIDPIISILPAFAPLAEKAYDNYVLAFKSIINGLSKKSLYCNNMCNKGVACKVGFTFKACKDACQTVKQVGGFELRIRFGDGWTLAGCVKKGVDARIQTSAGRGNTKSIAVYSEEDLKQILTLLSYRDAAEQVVATKGQSLNLQGKELEQAVALAKQAVSNIPKDIQKRVKAGRFGNQ